MDKFFYYLVTLLESALSVVGIRGTYEEPRYACVSACNFDPVRWGIGVQF
ncbi:hypothetical protein [Methylobacterium sp. Leaf466]|nr:hypothetical protein [Methylobacterium sp. Leaf466]